MPDHQAADNGVMIMRRPSETRGSWETDRFFRRVIA